MPESAPGPLGLVQSFAGTLSTEPGADLLGTREEAAAWLHAVALLPAEAGLSNSEHAALLRLREAVRDVLAAQADGREDPEAATRLTKALAEGRLVGISGPGRLSQRGGGHRRRHRRLGRRGHLAPPEALTRPDVRNDSASFPRRR